jgi:hypothetical protein
MISDCLIDPIVSKNYYAIETSAFGKGTQVIGGASAFIKKGGCLTSIKMVVLSYHT